MECIQSTITETISIDSHRDQPPAKKDSDTVFIKIPVTIQTVVAIVVIVVLAVIGKYDCIIITGSVYLFVLSLKKRCRCPMCKGTYVLGDPIGAGGFGSVFKARCPGDISDNYIVKKMDMADITEID